MGKIPESDPSRAAGWTLVPAEGARLPTESETASRVRYYGMRYYSSSQGRFITKDPIEEQGGLNLYSFCLNNGVNSFDVLGRDDFMIVTGTNGDGSPRWESYGMSAYDMYLASRPTVVQGVAYDPKNTNEFGGNFDGSNTVGGDPGWKWTPGGWDLAISSQNADISLSKRNLGEIVISNVDPAKRQAQIDAAISKYKIDTHGFKAVYDKNLQDDGITDLDIDPSTKKVNGATVYIGESAFRSHSNGWLGSTLGHEFEVHVADALNGISADQGTRLGDLLEIRAYNYELANATRFQTTLWEQATIKSDYLPAYLNSPNLTLNDRFLISQGKLDVLITQSKP